LIDSPKRSITKAASWRLFALVFLSLISFLITGDEKKAAVITILYHSIQVGFYFIHERMWTRVEWGKTTGLCIQMTGLSGSGKSTLARMTACETEGIGLRSSTVMSIEKGCVETWDFQKKIEIRTSDGSDLLAKF